MSMLQVTDLTFAYEGTYDTIFDHVSFRVDTRWRLGLIGRNGRGKTTFLRLLQGKYPYSGSIQTDASFSYFPYEVADSHRMTLDVILTAAPDCQEWEILRELALMEMDPELLYRPFSTLSNGEQTRVLLSALFLGRDKFLLIDEPTNHLDEEARRAVARYLKTKRSFILVSHDRQLLDECVDHILAINRSTIQVMAGNYSAWQKNKALQDQFELAENEKLEKEIGRLSQSARRSAGWSGQAEKGKYGVGESGLRPDKGYVSHKAAKVMKRAKSLQARQEKAVEAKTRLLHDVERLPELSLSPLAHPARILAEGRDLCLAYGGRKAAGPLNFQLLPGMRLALTGGNGSGKSTLLKLLAGEEISHTGTLRLAGGLRLSWLPQDTGHLRDSLRDHARDAGIDESQFLTILRKLGFDRVQFEKDLSGYSAGQKKKVLLAASLCQRAHLYLWDEPLNYIDLFSRIQIEELIRTYQPTMVFVEHDRAFRAAAATHVLDLSKGAPGCVRPIGTET